MNYNYFIMTNYIHLTFGNKETLEFQSISDASKVARANASVGNKVIGIMGTNLPEINALEAYIQGINQSITPKEV